MSRPTRLTPDLSKAVCDFVAAGAPLPYAGPAASVSWNTLKKWLAKGREGLEPYAGFVADVEEAKARFVAGSTMRIVAAGKKDWKATAWLLERRTREFAPVHRQEITGRDGGPVEVASRTKEEIREKLDALRQRLRPDEPGGAAGS